MGPKKIEKVLSNVLLGIGAVALSIATVIIFCSVVLRYCLGVSYAWMEEVSRYLCIWSAFSISGHVAFWNKDVTLEFVVNMIKNERTKWILQVVNSIVLAGTAAVLAYFGWGVWAASAGQKTYSNLFPMRIPYGIVPIGMTITVVFCLVKLSILMHDKNLKHFSAVLEEAEDAASSAAETKEK